MTPECKMLAVAQQLWSKRAVVHANEECTGSLSNRCHLDQQSLWLN
jgi:hypothetical protein